MPSAPKMALMSRQLVLSSSMMRRVLGMGVKLWCLYHSHGAQALILGRPAEMRLDLARLYGLGPLGIEAALALVI
jgi:hypothetical protein